MLLTRCARFQYLASVLNVDGRCVGQSLRLRVGQMVVKTTGGIEAVVARKPCARKGEGCSAGI